MKRTAIIILSVLAVTFFGACGQSYTEDIDLLTETIQSLNAQIDELNEQIDQLKAQSEQADSQTAESLAKQSEQIELLEAQIENLMGVPVEYTEDAPVFGPRENDIEMVSYDNYMYNPDNPGSMSIQEAFDAYRQYISDKLLPTTDGSFFVFAPDTYDDAEDWHFHWRTKRFAVYTKDRTLSDPILYEQIDAYDEILADRSAYKYEGYDGGTTRSYRLLIYFSPVDYETNCHWLNFSLKFGNNSTYEHYGVGKMPQYFNIYFGDTCIGTAYYQLNSYVSHSYFDRLFRKNLIKLGGNTNVEF